MAPNIKSIRKKYPDHPPSHGQTPVSQRSGNKVGWETFATKGEAEKCAEWARTEAEIKLAMGYDFGYCSPGSIREVENGFEVCLP